MNCLLDTKILIWWLSNSRSLPDRMRQAIVASDRPYVSAVCAWEISIKVVIGKLEFHGDIEGAITLRQVSNVLSEEKKQQVIALGRLG